MLVVFGQSQRRTLALVTRRVNAQRSGGGSTTKRIHTGKNARHVRGAIPVGMRFEHGGNNYCMLRGQLEFRFHELFPDAGAALEPAVHKRLVRLLVHPGYVNDGC